MKLISVREWMLQYNIYYHKTLGSSFKPLTSTDYVRKRLKSKQLLILTNQGYRIDINKYPPEDFKLWIKTYTKRKERKPRTSTLYVTDTFIYRAELLINITKPTTRLKEKDYVVHLMEVEGLAYHAAKRQVYSICYKLIRMKVLKRSREIFSITNTYAELRNSGITLREWCLFYLNKREVAEIQASKVSIMQYLTK